MEFELVERWRRRLWNRSAMLTLQNYPCDYTLYLEYGKVDCVLRESRGYTMSLHLQCINGANQGFLMRGKKISTALGTLSCGIRVRKRMGAGTAPLRCQSVEEITIRILYHAGIFYRTGISIALLDHSVNLP